MNGCAAQKRSIRVNCGTKQEVSGLHGHQDQYSRALTCVASARPVVQAASQRAISAGGEMVTFKRLSSVLAIVCSLMLAVLLLPGRIVDFEQSFPRAYFYITNLVYRSEAWTGVFDRYPEGVVDMASLGISTNVDAALEIEVVEGNRIDGRIWWQGSCESGSPYSGLLLDGRIELGGRAAQVAIWEMVGGHRIQFATGILELDNQMIHFTNFSSELGINGSRIFKNPEPAQIEDWPNLYCD
ncbi:hypothetical protein [Pararhodobacter aggregans]